MEYPPEKKSDGNFAPRATHNDAVSIHSFFFWWILPLVKKIFFLIKKTKLKQNTPTKKTTNKNKTENINNNEKPKQTNKQTTTKNTLNKNIKAPLSLFFFLHHSKHVFMKDMIYLISFTK
jgi:uncharacterized membrane protein YhiD involved in acid resistance